MIIGIEYWFNYYEIVQNGVDNLYQQEIKCNVDCVCYLFINNNCWNKYKGFEYVEFKVDIDLCFCYQQ